jgi:acetylornithine deacetylase/succinyl-diaminopimelate desuccinylase-like protein
VENLVRSAGFKKAQVGLTAGFDQFLEDLVTLVEIEAPSFGEEKRGKKFLELLQKQGLDLVEMDDVGNVIGTRKGTASGRVVVAAHLDTVFAAGTDLRVRRKGMRWYAPGICDDTRGLASLLALVRAMNFAGMRTRRDILFVANVGEEGPGDLRGMRHLFGMGKYAGQIDAFFTLDGIDMESLVTGAIGSYRYTITFNGPGGHSFLDFGVANPANALGEFVAGMAAVTVPEEPRTTFCVSMVGGGTSVNSVPESVWARIDLRSASPVELTRLDKEMRVLIDAAVVAENRRRRAGPDLSVEISRIGDRPASMVRESGPVIDQALEALRLFGFEPRIEASSTDANIPMSLGVPAVMIGSGASGGGIHTLGEWVDVDAEAGQRALAAILAAVLAVAELA